MTLHVVSFQVPFPADYGGVIEVFYKLKALKQAGVDVILHCFCYKGRKEEKILEQYAKKVYYYKRNTGIKSQLSLLPYIVRSRKNKGLESNLLKDDFPILFEGLHTCYLIDKKLFAARKKMVRMHNIEHQYYMRLFSSADCLKSKIFYFAEALRLKKFENKLRYADNIFAISTTDKDYFQKKFPNVQVDYLPCFFNNDILNQTTLNSRLSTHDFQLSTLNTDYVLYNADLSIESNVKVALFLVEKVMPLVDKQIKLILAGRNPLEELTQKVKESPNTELIANVEQERMNELINNARINLLVAFNPSGVKLKLLTTLLHSQGHCLANETMMQGTNLQDVCPIVNTPNDIADKINRLYNTRPTATEIQNRRQMISQSGYNNRVELIVKQIK
ncbi:MAG: glycosyltransferase family 1 protein [Bacteroidales bacterium]|nr:glycosyltransferase family 1 protein [Bacteroidales bacterium]